MPLSRALREVTVCSKANERKVSPNAVTKRPAMSCPKNIPHCSPTKKSK